MEKKRESRDDCQYDPVMPRMSTVLVTGASSGIGAGCCLELASRGWRVYAGVRSMEAGQWLCAKSAQITPVLLDVTDSHGVAAVATKLAGELGDAGLSGLVNNAGIVVNGPIEFVPIDELRRQLEVNVVGLVGVTQAMLPLLRRGRGRIVNISSVSGRVSYPFLAPYAASKFAVEAISDALRIELAPWGIRVALIEPGPVATPIWSKARAGAAAQANAWSAEARTLYADYLVVTQGIIDDAERHAVSVETVAGAVCHALIARRPRIRYPLGPGSRLAGLKRFIPDRLWDALVRWTLRRMGPLKP